MRKKHLYGLCFLTLCGKDRIGKGVFTPTLDMAETFKDVTCGNCKRTREYKAYIAGKFKEKP